MRLAAVVILVACKGGDKPADKPEPANPSGGGAVPTKPSVTGELQVTGAVTAKVHWKDDLAITCTWVPDITTGGLFATMTDDADTFVAFDEVWGKEHKEITFTSGKLKSASKLTGTTGFTMTGSDDRTSLTATVDADVESQEGTKVHIKGKLDARCPP
jgi:hypothetical protein